MITRGLGVNEVVMTEDRTVNVEITALSSNLDITGLILSYDEVTLSAEMSQQPGLITLFDETLTAEI